MYGTDLTEWADQLATALDLPVVLDPADLVLPGILLTPGTLDFDRLDADTASTDIELWLIAGDTRPQVALDDLTRLLLKLRRHLGDAPASAEPFTVTLAAQSPDPLPAFRCPIPITLDLKETTP